MPRSIKLTLLSMLVLGALPAPAGATAAGAGALEVRVNQARAQAETLAAELKAQQGQLFAAQGQAASAARREGELSSLLAAGQDRATALSEDVRDARNRLSAERRRLGRARGALADRLVLIYMTGEPDPASVVLAADGFDDLVVRSDYMSLVQDADADLAGRVEQVRDGIQTRLRVIEALEEKVAAYNARLDAARSQISAVRAQAESAATELSIAVDSRAATIATLRSNVAGWMSDIEAAQAAEARRAEAAQARQAKAAQADAAEVPIEVPTEESASDELSEWLGGPYAIPVAIVMCESGGDYGALNPSSGAGGAYQILPSTWELYGGEGAPHEASPAQQDAIAAQIYADSGGSAWVC